MTLHDSCERLTCAAMISDVLMQAIPGPFAVRRLTALRLEGQNRHGTPSFTISPILLSDAGGFSRRFFSLAKVDQTMM